MVVLHGDFSLETWDFKIDTYIYIYIDEICVCIYDFFVIYFMNIYIPLKYEIQKIVGVFLGGLWFSSGLVIPGSLLVTMALVNAHDLLRIG